MRPQASGLATGTRPSVGSTDRRPWCRQPEEDLMTDLRGLGALAGLTDEDPILAEQEQLPPDEDEAERAVRDHTTAGETRGPSDGNDPDLPDQDADGPPRVAARLPEHGEGDLSMGNTEGVIADDPDDPNGDDQDLAEAVAEGVLSDRPESPDAVGDMPAADDVRHEG
jgi:hypothetical protein